jgi:hypothetical protein
MRSLAGVMRDLDILFNNVQLRALLMHHVRDISEQLVQLSHALLDVADLGFALDDEGFLEVDLVLVGEAKLFLLLLLVSAKVAA